MALVRQPQYDRKYDGENGTEKVEAFVDTSTGQIFNNVMGGDSENGFTHTMVPTEKVWDYMNTADPSGKNIFGSQGYAPEEYKLYGDESGDSWGSSNVGGATPSGDIQIGQSLDRKGYTDVLNKYGIKPKYDPEYGYVLPANVHNAVTQEYFKNYGLGDYSSRGGITGFLDNYAVPLMMAATGVGMAGGFGAAAEGAAATEGALATAAPVANTAATAETAAAAGDAYLPGALSNPLTQAMPTLSNLAQAAATNAGMQLATTGTIDPEKVLESVVTGAAGSTLGNLAGIAAGNALDSNLVRSIVSGAVSGATQAAINGTDPVTAALASGAASGLGYEARENNINVPQQSINAVVSSIATGAPLEKTLLSAAMSMGVGAAKDTISGLSSADTQAPAPVETGTPLSPDTSGLGSVDQSDSTQTPAQLPSTTSVETAPDTSGLDSVSTDQGRTGTDALFYDENGNALDASGDPVYGSHNDVLTDPVTGVVTQQTTQPVTTPVTSTVIPRNTSTTTGGISTVAPSSTSSDNKPLAQAIPWLTSPNQAGMLTVKKDKNMSLDQMLEQLNPSLSGNTPAYAGGGTITDPFAPLSSALDPKKVSSEFVSAKPTLLAYKKAVASPALSHIPLKNMYQSIARGMAEGGLPSKYEEATPKGHKPEFITGVTGFYADGRGTGQSDDIPALLHDGDYVMDAETVSALGDGSSKAGREVLEKFRNQVPHESKTGGSVIPAKIADGEYVFPAAFVTALGKGENKRGSKILDGLREKLRAHKRKAPLDKIPPKAKSPLEYLKSKV